MPKPPIRTTRRAPRNRLRTCQRSFSGYTLPEARQLVHSTFKKVSAQHAYMDSAFFWLSGPLRPKDVKRLRKAGAWYSNKPMKKQPRKWKAKVEMHQPTPAMLRLLREVSRNVDVLVNRVDISLDLTVPNEADALKLRTLMERFQVQRWHGKKEVSEEDEGTYFGLRWGQTSLAHYTGRPSKVTGGHCCHLEIRHFGADPCSNAGFDTVDDLLRFDEEWAQRIWERHLAMEILMVSVEEVALTFAISRDAPLIRRWHRVLGLRHDRARSNGYLILRPCILRNVYSTQLVKDRCRALGLDYRRVVRKLTPVVDVKYGNWTFSR